VTAGFSSVVILAPNWLGDCVMALPAIADLRRAFPSAALAVAARRSVADVFTLAPFVDRTIPLEWNGRWWQRGTMRTDAERLRALGPSLAILLPNSFAAAWLVWQAGVPERWGYGTDMRGRLLTRALPRPAGSRHQGAYYQYLTRELGIDCGPLEPAVTVREEVVAAARGLLVAHGWNASTPLVVLAPGAAYGSAKRWTSAHVARLTSKLALERQATCVLTGSVRDASTVRQILGAVEPEAMPRVIDGTGTTIEVLAGMLALAAACVANDSGAMHLAAAVGTPVVGLFGPTSEYVARPLTREGRRAVVLTEPVWCRPCGLRRCPIDHRCMKRITPERVYDALQALIDPTVRSAGLQPSPHVRSAGLQPGRAS